MMDAEVNLTLQPLDWIYIKAEFHKFWLAEKKDGWSFNPKMYRDITGNSGNDAGKEIDILIKLSLSENHEIQIFFGHFSITVWGFP